jgi:hypothetical protein
MVGANPTRVFAIPTPIQAGASPTNNGAANPNRDKGGTIPKAASSSPRDRK